MDKKDEKVKGEKSLEPVNRDAKTGRFVPGMRGGPGRPPKSISITNEIKQKLAKTEKGYTRTNLHRIVNKIFNKALNDDNPVLLTKIWNYIDGLPEARTKVDIDTNVNIKLVNYKQALLADNHRTIISEVVPDASLLNPSPSTEEDNEG